MKARLFFLPLAVCLTMAGCKQQGGDSPSQDSFRQVTVESGDNGVSLEMMSENGESQEQVVKEAMDKANATPVTAPAKQTVAKPAATKAPAVRTSNKVETLYVETDDARGRVWGHVTMRGDRGTGTVHDEGENTWSVTVTRHGNELYAVDQNSRQYVFKIKK